jgi:hypothetical protein
MAEKGRLFTGARARFSIDGVKVGYARNVNLSEEVEYAPAEVLDNIEVEEYAPIAYRVRFSASTFRIIGETLKERGWFPPVGGNTEEHLTNILVSGDLTATIEDTKTGKIFATVEQCKVASHNWNVDSRGIVGEDMEFVAIRVRDESEV